MSALVEHFADYLGEFGVDATINGATVRGIFDNGYNEPFSGIVAGTQTIFLCATADVASITQGTTVTIAAVAYTVAGIEPDGTGMTRLRLQI